MEASFIINQLTFKLDASEARDLFQQVAQIQEVFEAETQCGCCQSEEIKYSFREVDSYKFYELVCRDCGAQFRFGQKKQTNELFPKRKDDAGNALPNHGWSKYEPRDGEDTRSRPRSAQQQQKPAARPAGAPGPMIPSYPDWDAAEKDSGFGRIPMRVSGVLYHIDSKKHEYVQSPAGVQ